MGHESTLAAIRQGDIPASQAWELLLPHVDTADYKQAYHMCDVLRSWAWKTLDRRRRDAGLREWVDLLNRVEAFLSERFAELAAKIELLVELLHESLAVAELASTEDLHRRKHVQPILECFHDRGGEWVERADVMSEIGLKPANATRLMTLLVDAGWVEQQVVNGREAAYRLSAEGAAQARAMMLRHAGKAANLLKIEDISWNPLSFHTLLFPTKPPSDLHLVGRGARVERSHVHEWEQFGQEFLGAIEVEDDEVADEWIDVPDILRPLPKLEVAGAGW